MEYLVVHEGGRGRIYVYELLWQGAGSGPAAVLPGLIETSKLKKSMSTTQTPRGLGSALRGEGVENAGPSRPHRGGIAEWSFARGIRGLQPKSAHFAEKRT